MRSDLSGSVWMLDYRNHATAIVTAATQGHARAAYRVGQMYEEGIGDAANAANAAGWYRIAAMQGHMAARTTH